MPSGLSRWSTNVAAGLVAAGLVLLTAGIGFALFSRIWATPTPLPGKDSWGSPENTAWVSLAVGLVVGLAVVRASRRRSWGLAACLAAAGVIVLIVVAALPRGIVGNYTELMRGHTPAQELPSAFAAFVFAGGGVLAVAVGGWVLLGTPRMVRAAWGTGVAIGVVIVVVVGSLILRDTDPDRYIDATTADDIPIPAPPKVLGGTETFSLQFDTSRAHGSKITSVVSPAGPGFVVRTPVGVRAFDSAGRERWHYLHTLEPAWHVDDFRVFDDGATVVVSFVSDESGAGEVVGLDAMTGKLLWRSTDRGVVGSLGRLAQNIHIDTNEPLYLVVPGDSRLTRIDTRTGRELWSVEVPSGYDRVDSEAGVGYFARGGSDDRVDVHYVSLDPRSGSTRFDVVAGTYRDSGDVGYTTSGARRVKQAGRNGVVFLDGGGQGHYINAVTGRVSPFDGEVMFPTVLADDFVANKHTFNPNTDTWAIRNQTDGGIRCVLPDDVLVGGTDWLDDQVLDSDKASVRAYRRSDCSAVPVGEPRIPDGYPLAVPGALLVIDLDPAELVIRGYT